MEKKRNLWVIPTDKPSKLFRLAGDLHLHEEYGVDSKRNQNIYITSDEEIIPLNEINSLPLSDGKDIQTNMSNI